MQLEPVQFPSFTVSVPKGARDVSTHCFVLPTSERVKPSIVVKVDELGTEKTLKSFVDKQLRIMGEKMEKFHLIEGPEEVSPDKIRIFYDWGEKVRFRQTQIYQLVAKTRVYTTTATAPAAKYYRHAEELDAIMKTVKPKA